MTVFFSAQALAGVGQQFRDNESWAQGAQDKKQATSGFGGFNPSDYCKDDACRQEMANPHASRYRDGGMEAAAGQKMGTDEVSGAISNHFYNAPIIKIDGNTPSLQRATSIMANAYEISHGMPNPYTDCKGVGEQCTTTYTTQQCQAPNVKGMSCTVLPMVTGFHSEEGSSYLGRSNQWFSRFVVKLPHKGLTIKHLTITNTCSAHSHLSTFAAAHLISLTGNSNINLKLTGRHRTDLLVNTYVKGDELELLFDRKIHLADFTITWQRDIADIDYRSTCGELSSQCQVKEKICEEGENETRYIQNVPVTLPCWKERQEIQCGSNGTNTCTALDSQNSCSLSYSDCAKYSSDGWCEAFNNTYQCETQSCNPKNLICGEQSFCLDGDCYTDDEKQNDEFDKAASALAAVSQAGEEMVGNPPKIFTGKGRQCSKAALGFADCCKDSGWGVDIGLSSCTEEERQLGEAKEQGMVVELGDFCAEKVLGVCIRKKEGACMFDSKLARIVQNQGRRGQLGISMGDGEHPNCRGITPEELQQIDFSTLDMRDFYQDMRSNTQIPDESVIQNRIQHNMGG